MSDQTGAAVAAAEVDLTNTATGLSRRTATDGAGNYAISGLPLTGAYRLHIVKPGFAEDDLDAIELRAGETATLNATLSPEAGRSEVTVFGTVDGVASDAPELGARLDLATVENTPVMGRKISSLALLNAAVRPARGTGDLFLGSTLFVVNAAGRRQTSYVVDGSTGDDAWGRQTLFTNVPLAALQEYTLLNHAFSAEYGRTAGSVVNIATREGSNDWHGDFVALRRPSGIQARAPLSARRTADQLQQASGAFSGPIVRDRTHFMVSAEHNAQDRDSTITSPLAPRNFRGRFRQDLALTRFDHQINERNSLSARLSLDRLSDTNPADAVGGLVLPSAARTFARRAYSAQLSETATLSSRLLNESRLEFQLASPITQFDPATPSTQFVRPGLATEGESRSANLQNHQAQWADTLSIAAGRHNLRAGGDAIYSSSGGYGQEFGGGYVLGQFTLKPGVTAPWAALTPQDAQRYVQSFGNASYKVSEWLLSGFVQDNWRLRPDFSLDLGLRYERQTFSDAALDFAPRAGFAWNPFGIHGLSVRGGYGTFYSQLRANLAAGWAINGPEGVFTFSAAPGQLGFPSTFAPVAAFPAGAVLPPRDIMVRPGERAYLSQFFDVSRLPLYPGKLVNPRTGQWTFVVEGELKPKWVLSVDYVGQQTTDIDRPLDVNAPALFVRTAAGQVRSAAVADSTRPIAPVPGGFRRIVATVNDGNAWYNALDAKLTHRFSRRFSMLATYTWSHAINTVEPDGTQQDPNDANLLGRAERASSQLDQRHRAVVSGWFELPNRFIFGAVASVASGRPFNITTGSDNNGDGSTADRPVVGGGLLGRNAGRGTPTYAFDTFVEREFLLPGDRARLGFRAEAFNLMNHANIVGRNGVWGNGEVPAPSFGQPLGGINNVDPGREFQFQARLRF